MSCSHFLLVSFVFPLDAKSFTMAISNLQRLKNLFLTKAISEPNLEKQSGDAAKTKIIPAASSAASSYALHRNYQGSSRSVPQPWKPASVPTKDVPKDRTSSSSSGRIHFSISTLRFQFWDIVIDLICMKYWYLRQLHRKAKNHTIVRIERDLCGVNESCRTSCCRY